jgi:plasmid stability protein
MRTTLSLDDDVAAAIQRRRLARRTSLKEEVNELLRAGLAAEPAQPEVWIAPTVNVGRVLLSDPRAWKDLLDDEDDDAHVRQLRR